MKLFNCLRAVAIIALFGGWASLALANDEGRLVRQAVEVAKQLRASDNLYDQLSAAGTLVEIGDQEALQFITDHLASSDWIMMRSAIDTLLNVQHPTALNVLYRYVEITEDKVFMKFLSESLASRPREDLAEFVFDMLDTDDGWVKKHALQALAETDFDNKQARMLRIAESEGEDRTSRAYAYYALTDTDSSGEIASKLIEIAKNWGPESQEAAAVGLGRFNSDDSKNALRKLRDSDTYKVQVAALASEAGFGNETAIDMLVRLIATGKGLDPSVAAASLRRMPPQAALKITENLFECCKLNSDVATRLLESWASVDADATKVFEWGLKNKNPDIRMQAVWLVGARGAAGYVSAIAPFLDDPDSGIRAMAAWTIVRLLGDHYEKGVEA